MKAKIVAAVAVCSITAAWWSLSSKSESDGHNQVTGAAPTPSSAAQVNKSSALNPQMGAVENQAGRPGVKSTDFDASIAGIDANKDGIREEDRYQQLETWLREHFPQAGEILYKWSGQVMEPMDDMAYIGKHPGDDNIYIVTGDSGNGITHGTLAGILISDLINGVPNPWAELYDPSRITLKAMGTLLQEQAKIFSQFKDYLLPSDVKSLSEIRNGEAAIVGGLTKIAVYRDNEGQYHAYSAVCPHMACVVQWNNDEKSFDCPCHGSRFTCEGKVINGPAKTDLSEVDVPQKV